MDTRLIWLSLAAFVGATEGGLIAGILPSISEDLGVTTGQAGQVMVGYAIAYAIGTPVLAVLLGRVGRRRILAWSQFGLAVCAALMAIVPFFPMLVGVRTVLAVCAGTFTGTAMATAALLALPGERGKAIQIVTLGQSLAVLVGVPLGAYVAAHFDWRINYAAIAVMAAAAALALYLRLPRGMYGDTQSIRERISVLGNPGVIPAIAVTLLFMTSSFSMVLFIAAFMSEIGLVREALPVVLLTSGIGAVASSFSAGRVADRLGNRRTVAMALLLLAVVLAGFATLGSMPTTVRLPLLMAVCAVQGYLGWGYWIAHCSEMAHLAPSSVPLAISLDMAALNIGMAIAAGGGGWLVDHWGAWALPYAAVPVALAGLALWLLKSRAGPAGIQRI